jgi:hypothetical protein
LRSEPKDDPGNIRVSAHNRTCSNGRSADRMCDPRRIHPTKSLTAPLNPRRRPLGRRPRLECFHSYQRTTLPVRQVGRTTGPRQIRAPKTTNSFRSHAPRDAPEPDSHFQRTIRPSQTGDSRQTAGPQPGALGPGL